MKALRAAKQAERERYKPLPEGLKISRKLKPDAHVCICEICGQTMTAEDGGQASVIEVAEQEISRISEPDPQASKDDIDSWLESRTVKVEPKPVKTWMKSVADARKDFASMPKDVTDDDGIPAINPASINFGDVPVSTPKRISAKSAPNEDEGDRMSVACSQCQGSGGYLTPGTVPAKVDAGLPDLKQNPVPSGQGVVLCRQCNGTGVTLACGWG